MNATRKNVQSAIARYALGERPQNFKQAKSWYIVDEQGKAYPLKTVYSMATRKALASFNTAEARKALPALGFKICNLDDPGVGFEERVRQSLKGKDMRRARLAVAARKPTQRVIQTVIYERNPDVVAEVLDRANGICELCNAPAPFRRPDGRPYLEIHHKVRLADNGDDTVKNAVAVCPNCHRQKHFGQQRSPK